MGRTPRKRAIWLLTAVGVTALCAVFAAILFLWPGKSQPTVGGDEVLGPSVNSEEAPEPASEASPETPDIDNSIVVVDSDEAFDGASYEAGVVLVDLVDWTTPDEAVVVLEQETGLSGFKAGMVSGDYIEMTLPEGLSVPDAVALLEDSSVAGAVQPNFVYRIQSDLDGTQATSTNLMAAPLPDDTLSSQAESSVVNDPYAYEQWAIGAMNLDGAWRIALNKGAVSNSPKGVKRTIAVIDEGFLTSHEDMGAVVDTYNSHNAAEGVTSKNALSDVTPIESNSHGTHVAGILGARTNNNVGIAGVSYNAQLQLIKAASASSGKANFTTTALAAGIERVLSTASTYNTRVINISVGGYAGTVSSFDTRMTKAIDDAYNKGIVVVCSAGNRDNSVGAFPYENCPSDYATAVAVMNLQQNSDSADGYTRNPRSNYNRAEDDWAKDLSAPGTTILSLLKTDGKYGYLDGTSMASPQVAGVVSLMFAVNPSLTADEAVDILYSAATDLNASKNRSGTTFDSETGFGIVNAEAAVDTAAYGIRIKGAASVLKGKTATLSLSSTANSKWTWSSSNTSVARVSSSGVLTGVKAGVAVITAKAADGTIATHEVTVYDPVVSGPSSLTVGSTEASKVTSSMGGTWKWSSSNTSVAKVDSSSGKVTAVAAGTAKITATLVTNPAVSASYQVTVKAKQQASVKRLQGAAALDTMRAIVNAGWATSGTVVIATSEGYWDGLTANGVAGLAGAPIVLTDGSTLSWQARDVISKLKPSKIVVCGGKVAISDAVVASATGAAGTKPKVKRLWGSAADGTAVSIYRDGDDFLGGSWATSAFICTDNGYWDALSVAPISYAKHMPIFLTTGLGARLSNETLSTLKSSGIKNVYIIGGESAVKPNVAAQLKNAGITVSKRIWGTDAVATSNKVAAAALNWELSADGLGVATSDGYWDALAGAALCGKRSSALVIVDGPKAVTITGFVKTNKSAILNVTVFGGTRAVSDATVTAIKNALK